MTVKCISLRIDNLIPWSSATHVKHQEETTIQPQGLRWVYSQKQANEKSYMEDEYAQSLRQVNNNAVGKGRNVGPP